VDLQQLYTGSNTECRHFDFHDCPDKIMVQTKVQVGLNR